MLHGSTAAYRADGDIKIPDRPEKFSHGQTGITPAEPLTVLKRKNDLQVMRLHAVVQETIVTDLLKAVRKHMRQETAYEFRVVQHDDAFRVTGL